VVARTTVQHVNIDDMGTIEVADKISLLTLSLTDQIGGDVVTLKMDGFPDFIDDAMLMIHPFGEERYPEWPLKWMILLIVLMLSVLMIHITSNWC
jgi:hypothetical protein